MHSHIWNDKRGMGYFISRGIFAFTVLNSNRSVNKMLQIISLSFLLFALAEVKNVDETPFRFFFFNQISRFRNLRSRKRLFFVEKKIKKQTERGLVHILYFRLYY